MMKTSENINRKRDWEKPSIVILQFKQTHGGVKTMYPEVSQGTIS